MMDAPSPVGCTPSAAHKPGGAVFAQRRTSSETKRIHPPTHRQCADSFAQVSAIRKAGRTESDATLNKFAAALLL